ncbi:hypothetical protein ACLESO_38660 [Pyxidicoccus sp. 3LG]
MVVFIPVFMYALFLDDLLRYSLDAQEAALSTVWDFTVQDYTKPLKKAGSTAQGPKGGDTVVQKQARLMFCDHESGKDRYTAMTTKPDGSPTFSDCEDQNHHEGTALVAHVCWLNRDTEKAKQVTCEEADTSVGSLGVNIHNQYAGAFTNGGFIRCAAKAVVENYMIPEEFLNDSFSKVKLSKENWDSGGSNDYHGNAQSGTDENAYFLAEQRLAILTDTWALTENANTLPGTKSGEMYDRAANLYQNPMNGGYIDLRTATADFFQTAVDDQLLNPVVLGLIGTTGNVGGADNPLSPNLAIIPHPRGNGTAPENGVRQGGGGEVNYFNSEWRDWDKDNNRRTYEDRGEWYMGCKNPGTC